MAEDLKLPEYDPTLVATSYKDTDSIGGAVDDFSFKQYLAKDLRKFGYDEKVMSSVEKDFEKLKEIASTEKSLNSFIKPSKMATQSWMNKYAFISYGGNHISGKGSEMKNTFWGGNTFSELDGMNASPELKNKPTAENIIKWSKTLRKDAIENYEAGKNDPIYDIQAEVDKKNRPEGDRFGAGSGITDDFKPSTLSSAQVSNIAGTFADAKRYVKESKKTSDNINSTFGSGNTLSGVGNLEYNWKDFSFCKYFGKIPNNKLVTLRRFKLPVLDNGVIAGKERLKNSISAGQYDPEEYLTSDSARALTYFGEGTGNTLSGFVGFSVGLNWGDVTTSLENPQINKGGLQNSGTNFLDNPYDASSLLKTVLGYDTDVSGLGGTLSRIGAIAALEKQVADKGLEDVQSIGRTESKANEPFKNGWQNRIYGPINVVTRTMRRERGLKFTGSEISVQFDYDLAQVGTLNSKIAMLDIISNMLALTYNSGTFYGGDYRFHREPTELPYPETLRDHLERMATGDGSVDYKEIYEGLARMTSDYYKYATESIDVSALKSFGPLIGSLLEKIQEVFPEDSNKNSPNLRMDSSLLESATHVVKQFDDASKSIESKTLQEITGIGGLSNTTSLVNMAIRGGIFAEGYDINKINEKLLRINPLTTGEPVGEWHLTVGNPMNPIMMIGNLVCTSMKMSFGETLGPDDFPTSISFKVDLKHGRDRDMGDIESMFNMGQGRFYVPLKDSKEPWETGFSSRNTENDTGSLDDDDKSRVQINSDGTITDKVDTPASQKLEIE